MSRYKLFGIGLLLFLLIVFCVNYLSPSEFIINLIFLIIIVIALIRLLSKVANQNFDKVSGFIVGVESFNSLEDNTAYDILSVQFEYDGFSRNIEIKSSISGKYQKGEYVPLFVYSGKYKQAQLDATNFLYVWLSIFVLFLVLVYFGYKTFSALLSMRSLCSP
ncbi:MAG: hypothetical protein JNM44_03345 [Chitinophagaceae bacterium]|nr:hypothetical protein [Chitinophagaceae bacterium]